MTFSRSEKIAIITIVSMIVIILITKYLIIKNPPKRDYFKHDLDSIIARREAVMDSMRRADSIAKAKLSFRAQRSGVETRAEREHSPQVYKSYDKKRHAETTRTTERRKASSSPSDSVSGRFLRSAPLHSTSVEMTSTIDLNTADTTQLKQLPGIGSAFAKWIVDYREKLGGYCETEQLLEVYRMDTTRYNEIKDYVKIDSTFIPNKLKINSDAFKIMLKHPYLEYDDVKKIVNHREQKGLITSWGQLEKIVGNGVNPKLRYYIDYQ